jgi:hypothetical protein
MTTQTESLTIESVRRKTREAVGEVKQYSSQPKTYREPFEVFSEILADLQQAQTKLAEIETVRSHVDSAARSLQRASTQLMEWFMSQQGDGHLARAVETIGEAVSELTGTLSYNEGKQKAG